MDERYDVVVIGGGAAGLSGALALARARRSVLVVDSGQPRNAPAGHMHNYLGREGTPPAELLAIGRSEVEQYGGTVRPGRVTGVRREDDGGFAVALDGGRSVLARRLLVATGLTDELPDIPGVAERWGTDVLHCPYCHGWEVRGRAIGVVARGRLGVHAAQLWRQWSDDVVLFRHTAEAPTQEEAEQLAARGIRVVEGEVAALEIADGALAGVRLASGEVVARAAVVVAPRFTANAELLAALGLETVEQEMNGTVMGTYVPADPTGKTEVPGVWVAGNVADVSAQVLPSAAQGLRAGGMINADLIAEDTRRAVEEARSAVSSMVDEDPWEQRYRSAPSVWSGRPNPQLVAEAADLAPGRALDAGCGEGADAIWLAERGWRVTAVDFSTTALERGAAAAAASGPDVAERIDWRHADLRTWTPPAGSFDLVTASYLQLPGEERRALFARLADAVAPGGTLLVVGHDISDLETAAHRPPVPGMFYAAEEVAASLPPGNWEVVVCDSRPRPDHEEHGVTVRDAVLRARRAGRAVPADPAMAATGRS